MFYLIPWDNDSNVLLICDENGQPFPLNDANEKYHQYQAWLAAGNTPEPWKPGE